MADSLIMLTVGKTVFENDTLEHTAPHFAMPSVLNYGCLDALEDECQLNGESICFSCWLAIPANLQLLYYNWWLEKLNNKDPTLNIPLFQVLNYVYKTELIEGFGYAMYAALVGYYK